MSDAEVVWERFPHRRCSYFSNSLLFVIQLILAKFNSVSRPVKDSGVPPPRAIAGTMEVYVELEQGICGLCPWTRPQPFLRVTSVKAHF